VEAGENVSIKDVIPTLMTQDENITKQSNAAALEYDEDF
jgi:hypothetical protein